MGHPHIEQLVIPPVEDYHFRDNLVTLTESASRSTTNGYKDSASGIYIASNIFFGVPILTNSGFAWNIGEGTPGDYQVWLQVQVLADKPDGEIRLDRDRRWLEHVRRLHLDHPHHNGVRPV